MMRRLFRYRRCAIRFRRWSRKNYAAFCSIGKVVTIGHLSAGIADVSLKKGKSILALKWSLPVCMLIDSGYGLPDSEYPPGLYVFHAMSGMLPDVYSPSSQVVEKDSIAIKYAQIAEKCQSQCCICDIGWWSTFQLFAFMGITKL